LESGRAPVLDSGRANRSYALEEAQAIGHAVPLVAPSVPITLKMPANIVRDVRAYSVMSGLTLSEIVTRAITAFLAAVRGHG
jgi:hypothetical protein